MGLRDRLRRLERKHGLQEGEGPCPQCGGKIIYEIHQPDGTTDYPAGEPCPVCDSRGFGGGIGRIRIIEPERS